MRLSLPRGAGCWRLAEMQEIHLEFLRRAAIDAGMTDIPGARERLFPQPLMGRDEILDEEFNDEWKELVAPELEMQFAGDVGIFLSDLDAVQPVKRAGEVAPSSHRLDVPLAHGSAWFSTLNQARLLLDLKHKLHEPADDPTESEEATAPASEEDHRRILALMRYEFFAWIQEWLVRHVL